MKRFVGAVSCAALLVVAGCGGGGDGNGDPDRTYLDSATFSMVLEGDPGALNPATAVQGTTNLLLSFAYDTLVYIGEDGELEPGLAQEWESTVDSVTLTLHPDATCSDGSPVTPEVVVRSIDYVTDPDTGSPLLGVLIPADLSAEADEQAGTVTLRTGEPNVFLLHSLVAVFIICGEGLDDPAILDEQTSGSGAYELVESVPNDQYTLQVREGYTWGPRGTGTADPGIPEQVVLRVITNESTAANLLLSGEINAAQFSGSERNRVEADPTVLTDLLPGGNNEFFFNQSEGLPGADPAVRRALAQSVNLSELATISTQGTGVPSTSLATLSPRPCRVDSVSGHLPDYDPAAAAAELEAAGWVEGPDGVRVKDGEPLAIRLIYNSDFGPGTQAGAEYQAAAWEELGVAVDLRGAAGGAWSEALFSTGDWDVSTVPIGVSNPSQLVGYLSGPAVTEGGSNFASIDNPAYESLVAQATQTTVDEGGCDLWAQAESALFDNVDVVPVVEPTQLIASKGAEVFVPGGLAQPTLIKMFED